MGDGCEHATAAGERDGIAEFARYHHFAGMDRLPLMQREAALGFKVVAEPPFAVDPEALRPRIALKSTRKLAIAVTVLIVDGGERQAEGESTGQAHKQKPARGALGGENRDGQRNRQQVPCRAGKEDDQRSGEKNQHPLREKVAPVASARDQDAYANSNGSPEQRVQIVERRADGEG